MFGLNENTQYYVCQRYVRMNMGINGLYQIVRTEMELPPLGGAVFIFFSKNRQQVKMLLGSLGLMALFVCCYIYYFFYYYFFFYYIYFSFSIFPALRIG